MSGLAALVAALLAPAAARTAAVEDGAVPAVARQEPLPVPTDQSAAVRRALREADRRREETVDRWIRIVNVASPSGGEGERARLVAGLFSEAGLATKVLSDGNVEAILPGDSAAPGVLAAHLDALYVPSPDNPVRRDEGFLRGPGVLDDGSGLAALVAAARLLTEAGYKPHREVRFVATVSEENGLVGARSYVAAHPRLAAFVAVDGILGAIDDGATGIQWTKYTFRGRGGHTLLSSRTPSPSFAAGRGIAAIADLASGTDAAINVGRIWGGTVPNAIPTEVSFTIDVRSDDPDALTRLLADVGRVTQAAADREGVTLESETLQSLPAARLPGAARSPLVTGASRILEWLDLTASTFPRGSSDHNIALLAGIPSIAVGATVGRHAHSPEEVADVRLMDKGVKQVILLAVLLGEGLPDPTIPVSAAPKDSGGETVGH